MTARTAFAIAVTALGCTSASRPSLAPTNAAVPAPVARAEAPPEPAAQAPASAASTTPAVQSATPEAVFEARAKPVLVASCMPCHFPGGKMYERLPFDTPGVVASHSEGILRRIKDPEKRAGLEAFFEAAGAGAPR